MSDLIKQLREDKRGAYSILRLVAADRIEQLKADLKAWQKFANEADVALDRMEAEVERLRSVRGVIRGFSCAGGEHSWSEEGQCMRCGNYATDLIDKVLAAAQEHDDAN